MTGKVTGLKQLGTETPVPNSPDEAELARRLRGRGSEDEQELAKRLAKAGDEVAAANASGIYDHVIVNDDLAEAVRQVVEIVLR